MELVNWNRGLLLAAVFMIIGGMALVSSRSRRERILSTSILIQGVVWFLTIARTYHERPELSFPGIVLLFLSALWFLWDPEPETDAPLETPKAIPAADTPVLPEVHREDEPSQDVSI